MFEGLLDIPGDSEYPMPARRKAYNPAEYSTLKGSGLMAALQNEATGQNSQMAANSARLPGGMAGGGDNEYAIRQAQGQMQPWDERQRQGQYADYLQQAQQGDALQQGMHGIQSDAANQQQQAMGNLIGTGLGAYVGYKKNQGFRDALSRQRYGASSQAPMQAWGGSSKVRIPYQ